MKTDIQLIWEAYTRNENSSLIDMLNKVLETNSAKKAQQLIDDYENSLEIGSKEVDLYIDLKYNFPLYDNEFKQIDKKLLIKSTKHSFKYAYNILNKQRFELGEPAIAKDAHYSYSYAYIILNKQRFELGEPAIAKSTYYLPLYIKMLNQNDAEDFKKKYNIE
jgi:hypothetical protein